MRIFTEMAVDPNRNMNEEEEGLDIAGTEH